MDTNHPPLVLAFVGDLYFSVRIESAGQASGCKVELVERPDQLLESFRADQVGHPDAPGEMETEASSALLAIISKKKPALLIFDLDFGSIPALDWIGRLKSDAGTAGYQVVAFGSHVNLEQHHAARQAGADQVLAKSRFMQILPALFTRIATGDSQAG